MKIQKYLWDKFLYSDNNLNVTPIYSHPITNQFYHHQKSIPILNIKLGKMEFIESEILNLPDDWFIPLNKKDVPVKEKEKPYRYMISMKGLQDNINKFQ